MTMNMSQKQSGGFLRRAEDSAISALARSGFLKLHFQRQRGLRIICYHGVCADEQIDEPWVPSYFVSASALAEQLALMERFGRIVFLPDVVQLFDTAADAPESCFAVTFDDVAACTFTHARDILAEHGVQASFFISTGQAYSGRLFDADVLHLARMHREELAAANEPALAELLASLNAHKRWSVERLRPVLAGVEEQLRRTLDSQIVATLRPMSWTEVRELADEGHDIGAHTTDHAILGSERRANRHSQIRRSIAEVAVNVGHRPAGFAYPNGGPGDYDADDAAMLRQCGIRYALSTRPGFCRPGSQMFDLPRIGIGRGHTIDRFALDISGLMDGRRRRQFGW